MPPLSRKVGLVVDRSFGSRIDALARSFHVWVVASPSNKPFIQRFWQSEQPAIGADPLDLGITSFEAAESESPEETCARITEELDEHHGEFAQEPPWSEIEVLGACLTPRLRQAFESIGATSFEATIGGFICRRDVTDLPRKGNHIPESSESYSM